MSKKNEQIVKEIFLDFPIITRTYDVESIDKRTKFKKTSNFTFRRIDAEALDPLSIGQIHLDLMDNGKKQITSYVNFHNAGRVRVDKLKLFAEFPGGSTTENRNPSSFYGIRKVKAAIAQSGRNTASSEGKYLEKFAINLKQHLNTLRGVSQGNKRIPHFRTIALKDQNGFVPFTAAALIFEDDDYPSFVLAVGDFTSIIKLGDVSSKSKADNHMATGVYDYRLDDANMLNFVKMDDEIDDCFDMSDLEGGNLNEIAENSSDGVKPTVKEVALPASLLRFSSRLNGESYFSKYHSAIKEREAALLRSRESLGF